MWPKILFFILVTAAILVVVILNFFSPSAHKKPHLLLISVYVQHPAPLNSPQQQETLHASRAFIFHYNLTFGPKNTSRVVGKLQGFVLPNDRSAFAAFNVIYLTFDTLEYKGSLAVEGKTVVGGTGFFAFSRGDATFAHIASCLSDADAIYKIKLKLMLPEKPHKIP